VNAVADTRDPKAPRSSSTEPLAKRAVMLGLKVGGAWSWTVAYSLAIEETREQRHVVLPRQAIALNAAWELIYSAGGIVTWRRLSLEDKAQTILNVAWLLGDLRWSRTIRRAGLTTVSHRQVAFAFAYQLAFLARLPPADAARLSALWQNAGFATYLAAARPHPDATRGRAIRFTTQRALGTLVPTLTSGVLRGVRPRYLVPGAVAAACDGVRLARQLRWRARWG